LGDVYDVVEYCGGCLFFGVGIVFVSFEVDCVDCCVDFWDVEDLFDLVFWVVFGDVYCLVIERVRLFELFINLVVDDHYGGVE